MVFGKASGFSARTNLESLNDTEGFRIEGIDKNDRAGYSVSTAGDVNGDGYDDIIIGAPEAASNKGESYVIFGGDFTGDSTISSSSGEDLLLDTHSRTYSASESRGNPLTSGDTVYTWSETRDRCLGETVPAASFQGDRSDLVSQYALIDSIEEDDQQDG